MILVKRFREHQFILDIIRSHRGGRTEQSSPERQKSRTKPRVLGIHRTVIISPVCLCNSSRTLQCPRLAIRRVVRISPGKLVSQPTQYFPLKIETQFQITRVDLRTSVLQLIQHVITDRLYFFIIFISKSFPVIGIISILIKSRDRTARRQSIVQGIDTVKSFIRTGCSVYRQVHTDIIMQVQSNGCPCGQTLGTVSLLLSVIRIVTHGKSVIHLLRCPGDTHIMAVPERSPG